MAKVSTINKPYNTITYYRLDSLVDEQSIILWICWVLKRRNISPEYITLRDSFNRSDEGNTSIQITADQATEEIIMDEFSKRDIDQISITGEYLGRMIVIGIDIFSLKIYVSYDNDEPVDMESLEKELELL